MDSPPRAPDAEPETPPDTIPRAARLPPYPRLIRAEANLLRLPLFALQTKGLRSLDGIECRGIITRGGETHQFILRASRSTSTLYPGPLSRAAHLAFLSLATERGLPLENPITWSWRDLCRRMSIEYSGRTVQHLKAAIKATSFLSIESQYAVYSKPDGRMIRTQEEGLRLYDRFAFVGSLLPDGGKADANSLWLADWFLQNLNAMFTAPLDYELWRQLDGQSPIASRLYEFLIINFYGAHPVLRINYETLAQFLPIKAERYRSSARRQLDPAFRLLGLSGVIDAAEWAESKRSVAQLHIRRGKKLAAPHAPAALPDYLLSEEAAGTIEVTEIRNRKPPEWWLVADFYRLWEGNASARPTEKELEQSRGLIEQYGPTKAKDLIPRVVRLLKTLWPEAKTFGSITKYMGDASDDYDRDQQRLVREREEQLRQEQEREAEVRRLAEEAKLKALWQPVWEGLTEEERTEIRGIVLNGPNRHLRAVPRLAEKLCLAELARRWEEGAEREAADRGSA